MAPTLKQEFPEIKNYTSDIANDKTPSTTEKKRFT